MSHAPQLAGRVESAVTAVRKVTDVRPELAVILGTGLSGLAGQVSDAVSIGYEQLPGFPRSTVETHAGRRVALVVHGGVLDSLMRYIQNAPLEKPRWFISANTSLNIVHHGVFYRTVRWVIETWGDVSHLDGVGHRLGLA